MGDGTGTAEQVETGTGLSRAAEVPRPADPSAPASEGEAAASEGAAGICPECGTLLVGDFCHGCGEKRPGSRDLSIRHFFSEAAQELTSVEHSKLYHTLRALLFRPGFLTNEWVAGRRRRYLKPLNLCLGIFALSLFAFSVYKPVSLYDAENVIRYDQFGRAQKAFEKLAAKKGVTLEVLLERITEKWQRYASFSTLIFVVGFAAVLQIVFMFSPRYFVEHLVFSMHFVSFAILTTVLCWPVYFLIGLKPGGINTVVGALKWLLDIAYMFFAVRAVYGLRTGRTLFAALVLTGGYFVSYMLVFVGAFIAAMLVAVLL